MKKLLVILLCLFAISCGKSTDGTNSNGSASQDNKSSGSVSGLSTSPTSTQSPDGAITISMVQPVGQKSSYETHMVMNMDAQAPQGASQTPQNMSMVFNMNMGMDSEVTGSNPDGTWTVATKIGNVKMEGKMNGQPIPIPPQSNEMEGKTYNVTYDKNGKVVKVDSGTSSQADQQARQMIEQMNPAKMLPNHPVKVGDTWPIDFDMPIPSQGGPAQTMEMKGTGRLSEVAGGEAKLDYDFTINMAMAQVTASGKGTSTVRYDIQKSRPVSNVMDMDIDMSGSGPNGQPVKAAMKMNMQMNLVNK